MRRRALLIFMAVMATLVLTSTVALAINTIRCKVDQGCTGTNNNDRLIGTSGSDNMQALKGADVLRGRGGDDNAMRGDEGNDRLYGGAGADQIGGGPGKDVLEGGDGFDTYFFSENRWGREVIVDTPIVDTDINTGHFVRFDFVTVNLTIDLNSGPEPEVKNAAGTSTLNWSDDLIDGVVDGGGDDNIIGREVGDNIQTFGGTNDKDTISSRGGNDFVYTLDGDGEDVIDCGDGANDLYTKDPGDTQINCEGAA